ncbi:MAG TPA: ABC transporter ATP-binding protein [Clostridiales bacterium]|jgi:ABC-2 type transport system ATP-binding protein|nr:ABC transporter ATP-binding protein [Clostridiales bacterium]
MITATNVVKTFDGFKALNNLTCQIPNGCLYGLVGSNGAGKSTFLRLLSGIYKADAGQIEIDGAPVYDMPETKQRIVFIPDELYFLSGANMHRMAKLYASHYNNFSYERYNELTSAFGLNPKAPINTFSKGMKRQAAIILSLSARPDFIFFDETFDGLDPVMRNLVRRVIYSDVSERNATAVISSHSLRELEDTCDQLALLHKGGILFESDVQNLKTSFFKVQIGFTHDYDQSVFDGIEVLNFSKRGSVANVIVRGDRDKVRTLLSAKGPAILDILPLTLEEVFIYEMEALGYAFKDVLV